MITFKNNTQTLTKDQIDAMIAIVNREASKRVEDYNDKLTESEAYKQIEIDIKKQSDAYEQIEKLMNKVNLLTTKLNTDFYARFNAEQKIKSDIRDAQYAYYLENRKQFKGYDFVRTAENYIKSGLWGGEIMSNLRQLSLEYIK